MNLLRANLFGTTVPSLWILVLMVSVGPFGDTEYTPSLPRIAHEMGVSYGAAQQTMTAYLFGYALVQLIYGPLSDRFGRKGLMLVGALLFLPETHAADRRRSLRPRRIVLGYRSLFTHRLYLPFIVINGLVIGVVYACLTEAPALVINVLGLKSRWFAVVAGGIFVSFVGGSILSDRLGARVAARKIVVLGLLVILAGSVVLGGLGLWGAASLPRTLGPIMLVFFGIALVVPNALGAAMRPFGRLAGSASAMVGFAQMGIASAANAGVSLIPYGPLYAMPLMFALLALLGLGVYQLGIRGRA